jgi:hypothetical protein
LRHGVERPSEFSNLDHARDRHVVVVGYCKSACAIAAARRVVASPIVVAQRLLWTSTCPPWTPTCSIGTGIKSRSVLLLPELERVLV